MPAITISREIGSKGDTIAEQAASRLGFHLVDKNTIEKVFRQYGFVDFEETYDESGFWARFDPHRAEMISMLNKVINAMVQHGNVVLLGRGGFAVLKGYADVLNVRIQAPFALRVQRVMESRVFASQLKAEEFVNDSDRLRRDFVNSMYSERWDSLSAFDLVIDTGKIPPKMAVDWLKEAMYRISHLELDDAQTTRSIKVDPVLADSVAQVLDEQPV
ncbi:MAG: cytidylate kinase-like family protein [Chloroflexi bacterium]|nr:MAG: cytidylate kinase-like family protein [Chloroflexota bacterium]